MKKEKKTKQQYYLCCLPRARLTHEHKRLVPHQDLGEPLPVLPDRQLQALLQDLIVAWRVRQVGKRVYLLLNGRLLKIFKTCDRWAARHSRRIHVPVTLPLPVPVSMPVIPFPIAVLVTPRKARPIKVSST